MTLEQYLKNRETRLLSQRQTRVRCLKCQKSLTTCYCSLVKPFESDPQFVILIHPRELERSIATGRMTHLCLSNSFFFEGIDFSNHDEVNTLIRDPKYHPVVLYPGKNSTILTRANAHPFYNSIPKGKKLLVFVIDGTWAQSRTIKRLSLNVRMLPEISFHPESPSQFLVRQQPREECYATIEAVYTLINWIDTDLSRQHENLMDVFSSMVNQQMEYEIKHGSLRGYRSLRGKRTNANI